MKRRQALAWLAAVPLLPALSRPAVAARAVRLRFAAAWDSDGASRIGIIEIAPGAPADGLRERASIEVPTRAHDVWADASGAIIAVARRPGDWLLRWGGRGRAPQWCWIEPGRSFNGHALASPDGRWLITTETDLETGAGLLGVRDLRTLEKRHEWPTHGLDPHELVWDRSAPSHLIVANGGIPTLPETGRAKHALDRMDSSLVRIDAVSGEVTQAWRLADKRLSLRHLAWSTGASGPVLGIALQAQHDDVAQREVAPVLAVFDAASLQVAPTGRVLTGYGGDITASGDGFAVSCPKADGVAHYDAGGRWLGFAALPEACALSGAGDGTVWAAGHGHAVALGRDFAAMRQAETSARRFDNHWSFVSGAG